MLETLGLVQRLSGHPELGYESLLEAAIARPGLPRARAELSVVFTQLGKHEEAAAAIGDLPSWTADDPFVSYARGCILAASGHVAEAKDRIAQASGVRGSLGSVARFDPILAPLYADHDAAQPASATASASAVDERLVGCADRPSELLPAMS